MPWLLLLSAKFTLHPYRNYCADIKLFRTVTMYHVPLLKVVKQHDKIGYHQHSRSDQNLIQNFTIPLVSLKLVNNIRNFIDCDKTIVSITIVTHKTTIFLNYSLHIRLVIWNSSKPTFIASVSDYIQIGVFTSAKSTQCVDILEQRCKQTTRIPRVMS